jgi:hypothetical protein
MAIPPAQVVLPPGPYKQPWQPPRPPQQPRGKGSIVLGMAITFVTLALAWWGLSVPSDSPLSDFANGMVVLSPLGLIVAGVVLAAIRKTSRTGAGILLGLGASILIAGGVCIAVLASYGG